VLKEQVSGEGPVPWNIGELEIGVPMMGDMPRPYRSLEEDTRVALAIRNDALDRCVFEERTGVAEGP
jgi:hypothetical protein